MPPSPNKKEMFFCSRTISSSVFRMLDALIPAFLGLEMCSGSSKRAVS